MIAGECPGTGARNTIAPVLYCTVNTPSAFAAGASCTAPENVRGGAELLEDEFAIADVMSANLVGDPLSTCIKAGYRAMQDTEDRENVREGWRMHWTHCWTFSHDRSSRVKRPLPLVELATAIEIHPLSRPRLYRRPLSHALCGSEKEISVFERRRYRGQISRYSARDIGESFQMSDSINCVAGGRRENRTSLWQLENLGWCKTRVVEGRRRHREVGIPWIIRIRTGTGRASRVRWQCSRWREWAPIRGLLEASAAVL
ncbi:hypothetical protein BD413DRAFT_542007 [Trametes elegans]|nr:hypothetical protein BD413DRAFT_542007 [Trametes elegans]